MAPKAKSKEAMFQLMKKHFESRGIGHDSVTVDEPTRYECDMCGTAGFGPRSSCRLCSITYHPYCETFPSKPPCFLHPGQHDMSTRAVRSEKVECTICRKQILGLYFQCDPTDRRVHPICFLLRQRAAADAAPGVKTITHFCHPNHSLKETYTWSVYRCDGCGTPGFGLRFRCADCDFDLHDYCATGPQKQTCFLHPGHEMERKAQKSGKSECYVCGDTITRTNDGVVGLHYGCDASKYGAHPLCFQLLHQHNTTASGSATSYSAANASSSGGEGARRTKSQAEIAAIVKKHFRGQGGDHGSVTVSEPTRYDCDMCGTPGFGARRSCRPCGITYHPYCESSPTKPPCFLHPGQHDMHTTFPTNGRSECTICHKQIVGLNYLCEPTDKRVHPLCFLLRQQALDDATKELRTITHVGHPGHSLTGIYECSLYRCDGCGTDGFGLRFRCEDCNFDLHRYCAICPPRAPCFLHQQVHEMARKTKKLAGRSECCMCGDPITRTNDGVVGLHYGCEVSEQDAHPLCVVLQQLDSAVTNESVTSRDTDSPSDMDVITTLLELALASRNFQDK